MKEKRNFRSLALFCNNQILCNCRVCTEEWSPSQYRNQKLDSKQQKVVKSCLENAIALQMQRFQSAAMFMQVCNAMTALQDARATAEYHQLYMEFRSFTSMCQVVYTNNVLQNND